MKILIIKDDEGTKNGYFVNPKIPKKVDDYEKIEKISKEDIVNIIDYMLENDVEVDAYIEGCLANPAQAIIYKNLYENFTKLIKNKNNIKKDIDDVFITAENKYN